MVKTIIYIYIVFCTEHRNISSFSEKSKQEKDLKDSLEIVKTEKQEEHLKYEQLLTKKDEEVKKLNNLCKSLEKLMNEKSAAEKEVREKVTDKDAQLKVKICCNELHSADVFFRI